MNKKDFLVGGVVGGVVGGLLVLSIVIIIYYMGGFKKNQEPFDVKSVPESIKLMAANDTTGNLTFLPNYLNDLQNQVNSLTPQNITKLTTDLSQLTTQVNNIVNGTTELQNIKLKGDGKINFGPTTLRQDGTRFYIGAPLMIKWA